MGHRGVLKILMISDVYFPRINGVSTSIRTFRKDLFSLGHEVLLVAPSYRTEDEPEDRVLRIPSRCLPIDPEDRIMKRGAVASLTEHLRGQAVDLIHIQTPFIAHYAGIRLSNRLGVPRIETYHTYFEEYLHHYLPLLPTALTRPMARWFSRRQCNQVDAVIAPSRAMSDVLNDYGVLSPIHIIPTGIEDVFRGPRKRSDFRRQTGIQPDRPVMVTVGRVAHEKNIDFLLEVLGGVRRSIPEVVFVIAGEGPALPHIKSLARRLGLDSHILFVGYLDRETSLLDLYSAGDLFVFASRTETQGLVLLEALAMGVPVVSTAVMGTKDILRGAKGAVVAEDDAGRFASVVVKVLQDPGMRKRLGKEAERYARTWSSGEMAARMASLYGEVIDAGFRPHR
jgi:glycosyltransferase involved in cell wall biosynthesis